MAIQTIYRDRVYGTRDEASRVAIKLWQEYFLRAGVRRTAGGWHVVVSGMATQWYTNDDAQTQAALSRAVAVEEALEKASKG